ncbi:hypothetical protein ACIRBX_24735 [Kitasatospora sp. NPDC096147]|uniref:hypothetical protein n=1 Tax=Kitasatospora sp. NPDC096147 TaxID=3364093 RepID=UPI0037F81B34
MSDDPILPGHEAKSRADDAVRTLADLAGLAARQWAEDDREGARAAIADLHTACGQAGAAINALLHAEHQAAEQVARTAQEAESALWLG